MLKIVSSSLAIDSRAVEGANDMIHQDSVDWLEPKECSPPAESAIRASGTLPDCIAKE